MPIHSCTLPEGGSGFMWGEHGKCFANRADAEKQAAAAHANGFQGDSFTVSAPKSVRSYDDKGRLHVARSNFSKAVVNDYAGFEVLGWEKLGLDPEKMYKMFRPPEELKKAAPKFKQIPVLYKHKVIGPNPANFPAVRPQVIGTVGDDVGFDTPYLYGNMTFWDGQAISDVESESAKEWSCSYTYTTVMEPGEFEGKHYDGKMIDIEPDHLALVEDGRVGSDVAVGDSNPFAKGITMKKSTELIFNFLKALSPKAATDSALGTTLKDFDTGTVDRKKLKSAICAMDAELPVEQVDKLLDTALGVNEPEPVVAAATDEPGSVEELLRAKGLTDEEIAKVKAMCAPAATDEDKPADEKKDKPADEKTVKAATDAAITAVRNEIIARKEIAPIVGEYAAQDSAETMYIFSLDKMKIDHKGVTDFTPLRALHKVAAAAHAAPVAAATDAAVETFDTRFPTAGRIKLGY